METLFDIELENGRVLQGCQVLSKSKYSITLDQNGRIETLNMADVKKADLALHHKKTFRKHSMIFVGQDPYQDYQRS